MDKTEKMSEAKKINVIGFSGKIGSGKNYIGEQIVGKYLNEKGYKIHSIAFADQIKYEIGCRSYLVKKELINFQDEENGNKIYNIGLLNILKKCLLKIYPFTHLLLYFSVLLKPIVNIFKNIMPINYYDGVDITIENIYKLVFKTKPQPIRLKLQKHAEERNIDNKVWINSLHLRILNIQEKSYDKEKDIFIITDVRFKNEIQFIKDIGGIVVRIIPENKTEINKNSKINKHISEIELDNYEGYDLKIKNTFDGNINVHEIINKIMHN